MPRLSAALVKRLQNEVRKEFPYDAMLRELHEIRAIHEAETDHLTPAQRADRINREAEAIMEGRKRPRKSSAG